LEGRAGECQHDKSGAREVGAPVGSLARAQEGRENGKTTTDVSQRPQRTEIARGEGCELMDIGDEVKCERGVDKREPAQCAEPQAEG
jgi:hypothetical protein